LLCAAGLDNEQRTVNNKRKEERKQQAGGNSMNRAQGNELRQKLKALLYVSFALHCSLFGLHCSLLSAGSLNPPASLPASATGYTLNDIYARLSSGTAGAGYYALFPGAAPGSTGVTLEQIYLALPGGTTTSATAGDVANGKTFIRRANGALLFDTGTMTAGGGHEVPATGQIISSRTYDDAYNESHPSGFNAAARARNFTMYNYTGGSGVETSDVNNSSVTVDNRTGLVWMTDGNKGGLMTWSAAITWCNNLNSGGGYGGYTGWRMPNVKELMSIVNFSTSTACMDAAYFRNTQTTDYWTSTTYKPGTTNAWVVTCSDGGASYSLKTGSNYVRPVRGGP
jgi:hypothetical protein